MRRKMFLAACISIVIMFAFALPSGIAHACSCAPPDSPKEDLQTADAVFSGKVLNYYVIQQSTASPTTPPMPFLDKTAVVVEVLTVWKGVHQSQIIVVTGGGGIGCGFEFQVGRTYLVYAYQRGAELSTEHCSRTTDLDSAGADLAALGKGRQPGTVGMPTAGFSSQHTSLMVDYLVDGTLLIIVGLMLRRYLRALLS